MPTRPTSGKQKKKKSKTKLPPEDLVDPRQEEIDALKRERDEIRSRFNQICSKLSENSNDTTDLDEKQPADLPMEKFFNMIDEICSYRTAFLNLFQETDEEKNVPVKKKITQLSQDEPELFRRPLTAQQRLTFVARERDIWKENAIHLQRLYTTIVDQLTLGLFQRLNEKSEEMLRSHRNNLQNIDETFSSALIELIDQRKKTPEPDEKKKQHSALHLHSVGSTSTVNKRNVSFADHVDVISLNDDEIILEETESSSSSIKNEQIQTPPNSPRLPLANETLVEKMDSNLRMMIIEELSRKDRIQKPPSRMSSIYNRQVDSYFPPSDRNRSLAWVEMARLVGISEAEIEHWLSQSLQYPVGRVISTWCNSSKTPPTVAELHRLISSSELNRADLAHCIEQSYAF